MDVPDAKYSVPGLWSFVRCTECRLVYLAETLADPSQGYPSAYSQHRRAGPVRVHRPWSPARDVRSAFLERQGYARLPRLVLPRPLVRVALAVPQVRLRASYSHPLLPRAVPGGAVLDLGCGNGRFLTVMRMLGWSVHGIEPDERSAEIAERSSGARIHTELDEQLYPADSFDLITMNHVLEHIDDPGAVLRRCFRLCRPGGLMGIVVPNWRSLGHRLFECSWYALEPPRHVVMYQPWTLARTLERAGFVVERIQTTSVREWATAFRRSWAFRTGRRAPRPLVLAWGALAALASVVDDEAGEEIVAWARKPSTGRVPDRGPASDASTVMQ
jgi:2-polyprenyl-3-methyl-5-hydroxy-6-metoxy-1,4-benzoquinol methylase